MKKQNGCKKLLALVLAVFMAISSLAGCAAPSATTTEQTKEETSSVAETVPEVVEQIPYWMPEEWDHEADVIVVGFGIAGAYAAKAAAEAGSSAIIVEKENYETAGGSTLACGGTIAAKTAESLLASARGRLTEETAQLISAESEKAIEWLVTTGEAEKNGFLINGFGEGLYAAIRRGMETVGADVYYEMSAESLVYDPQTKEVHGVKCVTSDGTEVYFRANKGVILATGGYLANTDMVSTFLYPEEANIASLGSPSSTGDGILMAMELGAALSGMTWQSVEWDGFAFKIASEEMGTAIGHRLTGGCIDARIIVNGSAKRFMNENYNLIHYKGNLQYMQYDGDYTGYKGFVNQPMYLIYDSTLAGSGAIGPNGRSSGWNSNRDIYDTWSLDNQAEVEKGWIVQADTLEELVAKLADASGQPALDVEVLKATIAQYNAACASGVDEYGRALSSENSLGNPPYYAAEVVPAAMYTIGGLLGGQNGETLDWNGNAIPRLYHAGDIGQPTEVEISGLAGVAALGTIAGRAVAALEPMDGVSIPAKEPQRQVGEPSADGKKDQDDNNYELGENEYLGVGKGGMGGDITIKVTVVDGKITAIEVLEDHETDTIGGLAFTDIIEQMIAAQGTDIDGVSGATITTAAMKLALEDALSKVK